MASWTFRLLNPACMYAGAALPPNERHALLIELEKACMYACMLKTGWPWQLAISTFFQFAFDPHSMLALQYMECVTLILCRGTGWKISTQTHPWARTPPSQKCELLAAISRIAPESVELFVLGNTALSASWNALPQTSPLLHTNHILHLVGTRTHDLRLTIHNGTFLHQTTTRKCRNTSTINESN